MSFKEKIIEIAKNKGMSVRAFESVCGLNRGVISNMKDDGSIGVDKLSKILDAFPDLSADWLLTGQGEMLKDLLPIAKPSADHKEGIPLIPVEAMAGFAQGETRVLEYECERYVVPMFHDAEFLIPVKGSSMIPKYNSGDIVACKKLPLKDIFFQWNKVYVLDTDQGALIKRIEEGSDKDHLLIISDNPKYKPFELHRDKIHSVALVIGVIRLE